MFPLNSYVFLWSPIIPDFGRNSALAFILEPLINADEVTLMNKAEDIIKKLKL